MSWSNLFTPKPNLVKTSSTFLPPGPEKKLQPVLVPDQIVSDDTTIKFTPTKFTIEGTIGINGNEYAPKFETLIIRGDKDIKKTIQGNDIAKILIPATTSSGGNNRSKTRRSKTHRQKKHRGRSRKHIKLLH